MEICLVRDLANPFHELHRRFFNVFKHPGILGKREDTCIAYSTWEHIKAVYKRRQMLGVRTKTNRFTYEGFHGHFGTTGNVFSCSNPVFKKSPQPRAMLVI